MHCKDVSLHDVDVTLTLSNIKELMKDWTAYVRTEVIILRNGNDLATVLVKRSVGNGLFKKVKEYEILSLPKDTIYVEDPSVDVINVPAQAELQSKHPGKTIIIKGMFSHINMIKDVQFTELTIVDTIPPEPSKLGVLVRKALDSGLVEKPVVLKEKVIDIASKVSDVKTEAVMFPCKTSGLTSDMPTYFLDEAPKLKHEVTLIGCNLSKRIFSELYGKEVEFINVCPVEYASGGKCIVKCCMVNSGHEICGDTVKVFWGTTVPEIANALNSFL